MAWSVQMQLAYESIKCSENGAFSGFADDVCRALFRVRAERKIGGDFAWGWRKHDFGDLQLTELACDPVRISKTRTDISVGPVSSYFVTLQLSGNASVSQCDREALLEPGDFTLIDSDLPYRIDFNEPVQRLILKVPKGIVGRRMDVFSNPVAQRFCGVSGLNAVFVNYLSTLALQSHNIEPRHFRMLSTRLADFLVAALENDLYGEMAASVTTNQAAFLRRIQDYILLHLADPDLSPGMIAEHHGITDRYLHSLFHGIGTTVATWIRDARLERCRAELENPQFAKRTVTEICLAWGFNDSAHFSRKFREKFGISPRECRARALN